MSQVRAFLAIDLDEDLKPKINKIIKEFSGIDTKIKASESNIRKLESQLSSKETQLRNKYGQMEGTLNNLNAQSTTITNFANNGKQ